MNINDNSNTIPKKPETQKASNRRMKLKVKQFDGVSSDIKIITGTVVVLNAYYKLKDKKKS